VCPAARDRAQNERYGLHCRIAETAGVSIGSVYQYFANNNTLFVALHERHVGLVAEVIRRRMTECTATHRSHSLGSLFRPGFMRPSVLLSLPTWQVLARKSISPPGLLLLLNARCSWPCSCALPPARPLAGEGKSRIVQGDSCVSSSRSASWGLSINFAHAQVRTSVIQGSRETPECEQKPCLLLGPRPLF
jgi:hypothetical protein